MKYRIHTRLVLIALIILLAGCSSEKPVSENEDWEVSEMFKSGAYTMIGEEGRLGFIYDDGESVRFYPNKKQKYMWHFWGEADELKGHLKLTGISQETGKQITVVQKPGLGGSNNGADAHIPSSMSLPSPGLWKLDAYIGEKLFGSVTVLVHESKGEQ